jgi:hypothetical protein
MARRYMIVEIGTNPTQAAQFPEKKYCAFECNLISWKVTVRRLKQSSNCCVKNVQAGGYKSGKNEIVGNPRIWEYINRSQTHECGNWD